MMKIMKFMTLIGASNVVPATGDEFPMGAVIAVIVISGLLLVINIINKFLNKK